MALKSMQSSGEAQPARGTASILAIATATPANFHHQSEFPDFYFRVTNTDHMTDLKDKFKRICEKSGIRKRHMYLTEEILRDNPSICSKEFEPSLDARQAMLAKEVPLLGMEAALKAIEEWGRAASEVTHLVFGTGSAVAAPTADCVLARLLGLRSSVARHFVFFQGCISASTALRLAKDLAENNAGARVLVVCSENMATWFSSPSPARLGMLVGHAIFGDGAAAAVVGVVEEERSTERPLFGIVSAAQTLVPDSEDVISGTLGEAGLVYSLSRLIPRRVGDNIEKALEEAFAAVAADIGRGRWDSLFYAVHPGGTAVLDAVEERLGLGPGKLWASRRVLGEYGNMWGPSALFVLDELRKKAVAERKATTGDGLEWGVMATFGPGLTVETTVLRSVAII